MTKKTQDDVCAPFRLLIDGQLVSGASTYEVLNPATGKVLTDCPRADRMQLEAAVAAARRAFPAWSATPLEQRKQRLLQLADALARRTAEFAKLLTQEQGKPLAHATGEIAGAVVTLKTFAGMELPDKVLRETPTSRIVEQRIPLGVVAAITPWNFPLMILMQKVAPALLAGNTVIAKPAPTTPLTTLKFGELSAAILPAGVLNIITDVNDLGEVLSAHADVAKVAFTGSTATGKKVLASAAGTLKRTTLELGGNDAAIVLEDADVAQVAPRIFFGAMFNTGQVCLAIKRVYVHSSLYSSLCDALEQLAKSAVVGDGLDPKTELGPLQNRAQFDRVQELVIDARRRGGRVTGAEVNQPGYFVRPTIVRDIPDDARLVQEEQFGPVLPVLSFVDVEDAIERANHSRYGLAASVWSASPQRAYEVGRRLVAGTVWINTHLDCPPDIAFGGAKESGIGVELGQEGLEEFTQRQVINIALG